MFCQIFDLFDDFLKFRRGFGKLHFEKHAKNWAKHEEKPRSNCLKPHFSLHDTSKNPKPGFHVPDPSLIVKYINEPSRPDDSKILQKANSND